MAVLQSVVRQMAAIVRASGAGYVVIQVAIWHGYYAAHPWLLAGPLAAVAWGGAAAACLRRRRPGWPLIVLDVSFYAMLAITAGVCVPPDMRGVAVTATVRAQGNTPVVSGALLLVVLAVHWTARGMLDRRAARADLGFAAADQEARDQYVVLSRNIERREHERLLHDTGLNTLTAISRGSGGPAVVARCRQDIALLERALAAPGGRADPATAVTLAADALRVTVRDAGAGFDPGRVDPARLGLRRSITERVADWGGRVSVRSALGQGILVSMSWPAATPAPEADLVAVESSW